MKPRIIIALFMLSVFVGSLPTAAQQLANNTTVYVPIISANTIRPFGFETNTGWLYNSQVYAQAQNLRAHWVRLNTISWREAQPTATSPINWSAPSFQRFEREVLAANTLGLQVMAIIDDHPHGPRVATTSAPLFSTNTTTNLLHLCGRLWRNTANTRTSFATGSWGMSLMLIRALSVKTFHSAVGAT